MPEQAVNFGLVSSFVLYEFLIRRGFIHHLSYMLDFSEKLKLAKSWTLNF